MNPDDFPVLRKQESSVELFPDLAWVWEGFHALSAARQMGFNGPQPISIGDISSYCLFKEIRQSDDKAEFLHLVQSLDTAWLKAMIKKSKTK